MICKVMKFAVVILCWSYAFLLTSAFTFSNKPLLNKFTFTQNSLSIVNSANCIRKFDSFKIFNDKKDSIESDEIDETTKKYGLEAGLLQAASKPGDNSKAKAAELLKKYGIAYLLTSITLAIISYAICYVLVLNGIDVSGLLDKFGIEATVTATNTGTAGIAYVLHKAASP